MATVASLPTEHVAESEGRAGATRVTVAVLGTLVGLAGVEHGIGGPAGAGGTGRTVHHVVAGRGRHGDPVG